MRERMRGKAGKIAAMLVGFLLVMVLFGGSGLESRAFASSGTDPGNWICFQNDENNNGVTERRIPKNEKESVLKWACKINSIEQNMTASFTPPLLLGGYVYVAAPEGIMKIDRESGKIVKRGDRKIDTSFALVPITYDPDDQLFFIPENNGRIVCVDAETLETKWVSEERKGRQMNSPIAYRKINGRGYVFAGTWTSETGDGEYFCLTVEDPKAGEEKKALWTFTPSRDDPDQPSPRGFYFAGALLTDRYMVFGTDDGVSNSSWSSEAAEASEGETATSILYSVDPATGKVIDKISGIPGDLRSTVTKAGSDLYWATRTGYLYKCGIGEDGRFDHDSLADTRVIFSDTVNGGYRSGSIGAAPVVYNGRVYAGVTGPDRFSADGRHFFAVIDDARLSALKESEIRIDNNGSLEEGHAGPVIYTVPLTGSPQSAPLVSTAEEGSVRVAFTQNIKPGGLYCFEDKPGATSAKLETLFEPEGEMAEYALSPLALDEEGTIYYKNDSGYLMAVSENTAYLENISVLESESKEASWTEPFRYGQLHYSLRVSNGTKEVALRLALPDGAQAEVNGKPYTEGMKLSVPEKTGTEAEIRVTRPNGDSSSERTYRLTIDRRSDLASLKDIRVSSSQTPGAELLELTAPYKEDAEEVVTRPYNAQETRDWLNIWPEKNDPDQQIKAFAVSGVGNGRDEGFDPSDKSLAETNGKFKIYFEKGKKEAVVRLRVTSASGGRTKEYTIRLVKTKASIGIGREAYQDARPASLKTLTAAPDPSSKTVKVSWNKAKNAYEYRVRYKKASAGKYKTVWVRAEKYTLKKLRAKEKYVVEVTPYSETGKAAKYSSTVRTVLLKTSLRVRSGGAGSASVVLKKTPGATGYKIVFSRYKSMKRSKTATVKGYKNGKVAVRKLSKGKVYYFKAYPYVTYKGKIYAGRMTAAGKIKIK